MCVCVCSAHGSGDEYKAGTSTTGQRSEFTQGHNPYLVQGQRSPTCSRQGAHCLPPHWGHGVGKGAEQMKGSEPNPVRASWELRERENMIQSWIM